MVTRWRGRGGADDAAQALGQPPGRRMLLRIHAVEVAEVGDSLIAERLSRALEHQVARLGPGDCVRGDRRFGSDA